MFRFVNKGSVLQALVNSERKYVPKQPRKTVSTAGTRSRAMFRLGTTELARLPTHTPLQRTYGATIFISSFRPLCYARDVKSRHLCGLA
jgi:hypothetical protein